MYQGTLEEVRAYADEYARVPVFREMLSDVITPIGLLRKLKAQSRYCYLLESVEHQERWGRYTFLGYEPTLDITCMDSQVTVTYTADGSAKQYPDTDPTQVIREILQDYRSPKIGSLPSFTGGLVGYFSYDFIKYSEPKLRLDALDEEGFLDVDLMLFDRVIAFDNFRQKIILIANVDTSCLEESFAKAQDALQEMEELILHGQDARIEPPRIQGEFKPLFNKEEYMAMVEKARHYIYEGDIFQVVLSNRLHAPMEGSLFETYRRLRTINPSPYMFYFSGDDIEVAGASPETLVKLEDGVLHTFPLAGTRPRGASEEEDARLEEGLLQDEKECAEHNMLVDLGRNDLGRISAYGTVKVEKYMEIQRFSHVMHIGSTVVGQIGSGRDALDAVRAVLPAGTLSGAPKFRACEIINELENNKRGIYGGAIGYVDFTGNLDTCIGIRIAYKKNGKVFVRSGAGIVADSVPAKEYQECINKAQAVVTAIKESQEER
jgi:anthranilate synthase component 1